MAHELTGLSNLSVEELDILFSSLAEKYTPIEINGKVYMIPEEVNNLIDGIASQLEDLKMGGIDGVS
tara:strand:- start:1096 stop:1296 length:201 start_codon:yes stop_codon:yes gene_type:complete